MIINLDDICNEISDSLYENKYFYQSYTFINSNGENKIKIDIFTDDDSSSKIKENDLIIKYNEFIEFGEVSWEYADNGSEIIQPSPCHIL